MYSYFFLRIIYKYLAIEPFCPEKYKVATHLGDPNESDECTSKAPGDYSFVCPIGCTKTSEKPPFPKPFCNVTGTSFPCRFQGK